MLVLTRTLGEVVVVEAAPSAAGILRLTVLGVRGGRVSLGFAAGPEIAVHRLEVWERGRAARPRLYPPTGVEL